ncbi:50S ribosomal protein L3 N(5)-glutamine methyltransferase [Massilia sp. W12]|uniref:50S ribosomal protein L3 N(5)-glutamine methyltransferase n=1 Tax=Massilia sp. W12 TaxID=3126507 RepID=UPI0030D584C9
MNPDLNLLQTVRDLLRYGVTRFNHAKLFFGHGSSNAFDEAAYLILHTLQLPLDRLEPFLDARLLPEEVTQVLQVIERRATDRVPAAYITNEGWLGNYRFYVDERVIVPRSFIAELIPDLFSPWVEAENVTRALDVCTGSGCLAIMLADAFPQAQVDALDLSHAALQVASRNVEEYELAERVKLYESDLYAGLPAGLRYDLIISNPPYVNSQSMQKLPKEYMAEPEMALAGGEDGMDLVRRIISGAAQLLEDDGVLVVEIGNERENAERAFPRAEFTWLSTSAGDDMVFLLTADQVRELHQSL